MSCLTATIRLLLADVDGTLVTPDKTLTQRTIDAVPRCMPPACSSPSRAGVHHGACRCWWSLSELTTPVSAFNGGIIVEPDLTVIEQKLVPESLVKPILTLLESHGLDTWIYRGAEWYVRDPKGPHVDREAATVEFQPTVVETFDDLRDQVAKIVGVSDDHDAMAKATEAAREQFCHDVTAAQSQPYYLDVTHPAANKGEVVKFLSSRDGIPTSQIATIGDMPNDVLMFAHSGLSIAMGNASSEVQRAARMVTTSNQDEGFANAVERYILNQAGTLS